ncbi:MAG: DM13 domain-containing protein [Gammaproteobacteria bacterium]|nr:DM13 domain-containing protein [Gammaproteobacteria bacterium]
MKTRSLLVLLVSHLLTAGAGFAAGIYVLPLLTAPPPPDMATVESAADNAIFSGTFSRARKDSDMFHWGEGEFAIGPDVVSFSGRLAPGPDYRLYLSPEFVETEADFNRLKSAMVQVGPVRTFENFVVPVPAGIDPADYRAAVVWCESFGQYITSGRYAARGP